MKRFLSLHSSEMLELTKNELFMSLKSCEGRIIVSENIVTVTPLVPELTNAEVSRAFGADIIILNTLDVFNAQIQGLPKTNDPIKTLKKLVGRPIGVNLEPVDPNLDVMLEQRLEISKGRKLSRETAKKLNELGFDFVCLTGNPSTGVTNNAIIDAIKIAKEEFNGLIIAGKMHGSGTNENIFDEQAVLAFLDAGADIIMIPAPGTVPSSTLERCTQLVDLVKSRGKMTLAAIGTSQETSDKETIRQIGLYSKMAGFDMHHVGDAGAGGIADPENILELSKVVRGKRHTIRMMSTSINR